MRKLLLWVLLLLPFAAAARNPFIREFWLNDSRTPLKTNTILQDSLGYIWLGTETGIYRFNGKNFFRVPDSIGQAVTYIGYSSDKQIWIGFRNGRIGVLSGINHVTSVHFKGAQPSTPITSIAADESGATWIGTEDGVYRVKNNLSVRYDEQSGLSDNFIYSTQIVGKGHLLAGSDNGINELIVNERNQLQTGVFNEKDGLPDNIVTVIKKFPGTNTCWIGMQQGGVGILDITGKRLSVPSFSSGWKWGQVNDILLLPGNRACIATEDGYLLDVHQDKLTNWKITREMLVPGKKFFKLWCDKSGNIWCTSNYGLTMLSTEYLTHIELPSPYLLRNTTAMACDKNNVLWLAQKQDLLRFDMKQPVPVLEKTFAAKSTISSMYIDRENRLWVGTFGSGLWYKEPGSKTFKRAYVQLLDNENILSITGNRSGLWISSLNGISHVSYPGPGGTMDTRMNHNKHSGIGSDYIYQLYTDRKDNIWMATDGAGVCMYDGNQYHHWNIFSQLNSRIAYTVTEDAEQNVWVGTLSKDLFCFRNKVWKNVRLKEIQDIDINISTVIGNGTGQIIAVYQRCIDLWYPGSNHFRHFNSRLGNGIDSTSSVLNCGTKDNSGSVIIPYEKGLLVFENQFATYDIQPDISITQVSTFMKPVDNDRREFGHNENYFTFRFEGLNFTNPERLNYRYMLKGYSDNWVYTNEETTTFPKLPPGNYTFKVQSSLNGDFSSAKEATFQFTIQPPFWKKKWFIVMLMGLLSGTIYAYVKIREKRLKKLAQLQQQRMAFEYEHLKSQVNPHFLFNSLNTLTNLIEENPEAAADYTTQLSDLYRNMLTYRDRDLITLEEEWDILSTYMYIQQSRFGNALQLKADIPERVMVTRKIVPMALQLLVENAIKHNIVSLSTPLIIHITADENEIIVRNILNPKLYKEKGAGLGLANIENRYLLLTRKHISYGVEQQEYVVRLPLI